MADIRKRVGTKGTTYQVRYPNKSSKSGYAFKTFNTLKAAREFVESGKTQQGTVSGEISTIGQGIDAWLKICEKEGRDGRDPVTTYTLKTYQYRAALMKAYGWTKQLNELSAPDIVEFRSWLVTNYSRDQARKVLSSFNSMMKEMAIRGHIASNIAAGISVRGNSRYDEPVTIPTPEEVQALLMAADRLANSKNKQIARTWQRYRPMLYLAADSGMRPQEYLVVPRSNIKGNGVEVDRALERPDYRISVTKTPSGRRFIDLSPDTLDMVRHYAEYHAVENRHDLVFPTSSGKWQGIDNWRNRGFSVACIEAGLVEETESENGARVKPKYTPYALRHFYASMLIERRVSLKRIQKLMGHRNIETTLNVYGHLIEKSEATPDCAVGLLAALASENRCGESVANAL